MKKYLISILCGLFLLPGCDYLNMVPEKDIETIESIFEQRTKVEGLVDRGLRGFDFFAPKLG